MRIIFELSTIEEYVDRQSYGRGKDYYNRNMIHSTVQMGALLKGRCKGSQGYSYYVQVLFDVKQSPAIINSANCSCPVSHYCKHIVALLLAYHNESRNFREQTELISYLSKQKKDWLIELLLEFAEKDDKLLERLFKIKDGRARDVHAKEKKSRYEKTIQRLSRKVITRFTRSRISKSLSQ